MTKRARRWLAVVWGTLLTAWADAGLASVFINEIHYDNEGTDVGEFIEIAGPAGTDLAGWSIVLYNGVNGLTYNTTALSGIIPNQQNGFGTAGVSYPTNGIQNGAPDGIALVNGTTVVQFLSYEGSFTASDGPAVGMTSNDIGVVQQAAPIGQSLQLAGTGISYAHFVWSNPAASTFGAVNTLQTFLSGLVINEVDYDQPGTDTAEFIELFNSGTAPLDLSGFAVDLFNGSTGTVYDTISLPGISLAPGEYFVICGNGATVLNCDLVDGPDTNFIQNGAPDAIGLRTTSGALVDALSYEGDTAYAEGSGAGLEDDPSVAHFGLSRYPNGVDTNVNNVDFSGRCITPGFANTATTQDCLMGLIINEVDYNQPGTDTAEFIELFNRGTAPLNLSAFAVDLFNGSTGTVYGTILLPGIWLAPGEYFVICGNSAAVLNCDLVGGPATNFIQNGTDAIGLRTIGGALVDALSYEGDTAYAEGSGIGLEDNPLYAHFGLSRYPNGVDTNMNNVDFSGRCITPGFVNASTTPDCPDPATLVNVPEPATLALLGLGLAGLVLRNCRQTRQRARVRFTC